jgi:hypothetical protein
MQVSGSENHHVQPWFESSVQRGSGNESLGPASDIGGFSFAGLMQQEFAAKADAAPATPVAVSSLAAAPATLGSPAPVPISTARPAVESAPAPAVAAAQAAVAYSPTVATVSTAAAVADSPAVAAVSKATVAASAENPPGTGQVTASGAPSIMLNTEPSWDARNCTGPEIYNPYYGTSTSPIRPGYVTGFDNWFQTITLGPPSNSTLTAAVSATEEGAQEALRLVQQYVPDAKIVDYMVTGQVGGQVSHAIQLPDGTMLNAGLVVDSYYHQGWGVDSNSGALLRQFLNLPADAQPVETA